VLTGEPLAAAPDNPFPLEAVAPRTPPPGAVLRRIVRRQGLASARPEALWGYESMRVALDAIVAAERGHGPARRAAVVRAALTPRVRQSPIGGYRVHASGGVTGLPLALYRLDGTSFEPVATLP
jgi:hypothetical protein